jgi:O-succinylbenzoate synthase
MQIGADMITNSSTGREAVENIRSYRFDDNSIYPTARLAIEMALIDALTKNEGISVARFIGLPDSIHDVPYGKSIGSGDVSSILDQVERALLMKAKKIKLKISPSTFENVINAIDQIRILHPEVELMVDANGSFDPEDENDIKSIELLDKKSLLIIEEPVSRIGSKRGLDAVRYLKKVLPAINTPICLDDCLRTLDDCELALDEGLADIINIKPGRIGSFLESVALINNAKARNKQVMVGGMFEATPGRSMTSILGAYCVNLGFNIPGDLSLAQERLVEDLVTPDKKMKLNAEGYITLPTGPGWGF